MASSLKQTADERGIRYFLISFTDLAGVQRSKLAPASAIEACAADGAAFAGFAAWLGMTPADPDILAFPDPRSLIQLPWRPEVGWMAADLHMNGAPLPQAPRVALKRQIAAAAELGLTLKTGVEAEFFLLQADGEAIFDGADVQAKPCYDQQALMRRYDVIAEICDAMASLGWEPYQNDHEDGNGQFEMNWAYADALVTADRHAFFKYMVKSVAERHGLRASFMPKPFAHLTGNGCHVHASLWRDERNLFDDAADPLGLSAMGYQFIGGLLAHAPALTAVLNPVVNSYKRLHGAAPASGATWSPARISFAGDNRTHMIRIPAPGRFELRLADGAVNPYLLPAALLAAGLDGILARRDPGPPCDASMDISVAAGVAKLPRNLLDAVRAFEASEVLQAALCGPARHFVEMKRREWDAYMGHLTRWEVRETLDC